MEPVDREPGRTPQAPAVVGIGASAGGISALQTFFTHMPSTSNLAFVVVLHLSQDYVSNLASLLQNSTSIPVLQLTERTLIEPNHIYVIPPNKQLTMEDGHLQLNEPERQQGRRVTIDLFFRTLAETQGRNATAIVLSGDGSDGRLGLTCVKEMGGLTLVQDPEEAEFDDMPRSAIASGLVDLVLPVAQMPSVILSHHDGKLNVRLPAESFQRDEELQRLREQLQMTIEQYETSTEELKASNEELQAMNQELRSATAELETSKEELQSVNEELITVNQELKNKIDEITRVNSDLQNLMGSTDIGTIFLDRELRIKRYTPQVQELFNLIPTELNRPLAQVTHRLAYDTLIDDATRVLERLAVVDREVLHADNRWFMARLLPYRTVEDKIDGVIMTFVDITERKRSELALRASEERLRLLVESVQDYAIFTVSRDGRIDSWNTGAERMFGYSESQAIGQHFGLVFTPEDRAQQAHLQEIQQAEATGNAVDERWHLRKDGSRFFGSGTLTALRDTGGVLLGFVKIMLDLTRQRKVDYELRKAHDELEQRVSERTQELEDTNQQLRGEMEQRQQGEVARRGLLRQLLTIQEEERRRISRELHDQVSQQLVALSLGLQALKDGSYGREQALRDVEKLQSVVETLGKEMHQLALDLRPTALDDLGLTVALANYSENWSRQSGIEVVYHSHGLDHATLPMEIETTIYRVMLEALTNVVKHAGATQVSIIVDRQDSEVTLIIEDNGHGFDPEQPTQSKNSPQRLGLVGMQERAALVDGTLLIESTVDHGTTIFLRIPLQPTL